MTFLHTHSKAVIRALAELGQSEKRGLIFNNPRVVKYWVDAKIPMKVKDDEVAWCAAFVGMALENTGTTASRSGLAKSYLNWGVEIQEPKLFCLAVLNRAGDPNGKLSTGHVGFVVGFDANNIYLLGGNQGDKVSIAAFPRSRVHKNGYRWVSKTTPFIEEPNLKLPLSAIGFVDDR